jgi:hypothetical protein
MAVLARIQSFAQPSEVDAPMELLRAGMVLHARGIINTKVIQQNIDWIWPFWVQQQFDPTNDAFLPRAFSITHINLTHRNWTAVGLPECEAMPIVDPRGMVTPFFDGWSLDAWILPDAGPALLPSRAADDDVQQRIDLDETLTVVTDIQQGDLTLNTRVDAETKEDSVHCRLYYQAKAAAGGWLVVAVRPFNPEGVSFINYIHQDDPHRIQIDRQHCLEFSRDIDRHVTSNYKHGDVYLALPDASPSKSIHCDVGLATAAAMFRIEPNETTELTASVDLAGDTASTPLRPTGKTTSWPDATRDTCEMKVPDERFQHLYEAAVRTLILLSPQDAYPGPFTYKRFWFRDAAYLMHTMLCLGMDTRIRHGISRFRDRQTLRGYFQSQQGEWDSNGQVLWLLDRYEQLTGKSLSSSWPKAVRKAVHWIQRKRLHDTNGALHEGLLPAGFSAEHLGNNDYYYWDDYWSVAGLHAAARIFDRRNLQTDAAGARDEANSLMHAIDVSLTRSQPRRQTDAIPASPHRRMDAGAVGSLVAGYPLHLLKKNDPRLLATADWLHQNCLVHNAFFQQMIHSGLNAYLTLHLAQVFLRAGRPEYWPLIQAVADLASPTGQWPEAVHPKTRGGCMGDGQHAWAAADWIMAMRHLFIREESNRLVIAPGIPAAWLIPGENLRFGPTFTRFGPVSVIITPSDDNIDIAWEADWRRQPAAIEIALPGAPQKSITDSDTRNITIPRTNITPSNE